MLADYQKKLTGLLDDPNSFQKTPGFQFALDTGLQGVNRANSKNRASGNALAELTKFGTGLASQEYGNQVDRMGRLVGQEQQFSLGQESNAINRQRSANDFSLGQEQNRLTGQRIGNEFDLGNRTLSETGRANDQRFGLGMFEATSNANLRGREIDQGGQRDWWDYQLGQQRNQQDADQAYNQFQLGADRADLDWMNAGVNRGNALRNWLKR